MKAGRAFTIVELLVVVTVIVVLLALLMPGMSKAIYRAQLQQCAGRLRTSAAAVVQYTFDHKRSYPARGVAELTPRDSGLFFNPMQVVNPARQYDVRRPLKDYIVSFNEWLQCPLVTSSELDNEGPGVVVETSYMMMWGWQYHINNQRGRGMFRLGDRYSVAGDNGSDPTRGYSMLIADMDLNYPVAGDLGGAQSAHPDYEPSVMFQMIWKEEPVFGTRWNLSRWQKPDSRRGLLDDNFAYDDLAVIQVNRVVGWGGDASRIDDRLDRIPLEFDGARMTHTYDRFYVPRR